MLVSWHFTIPIQDAGLAPILSGGYKGGGGKTWHKGTVQDKNSFSHCDQSTFHYLFYKLFSFPALSDAFVNDDAVFV